MTCCGCFAGHKRQAQPESKSPTGVSRDKGYSPHPEPLGKGVWFPSCPWVSRASRFLSIIATTKVFVVLSP